MKTSKTKIPFCWGAKILDRYIAREFLFSYIIALFVVLSLRILLDMLMEFDEFAETGSVVMNILGYYGPKTFEYFRDFSGAIIMLAAAFSLARLTRQNELIAVLASGTSLKRLIAPIVLIGFLLNLLMVCDQEFIIPKFADQLTRKHDETGQNQKKVTPVWLQLDRDNALLSAKKFNPNDNTLTDLTIITRHQTTATGRIVAEQAQWDYQKNCWILKNGLLFTNQNGAQQNAITPITEYPSDLNPEFLWLQRNSGYKTYMSSAELNQLLQRAQKPAELAETLSEKHFRFTDPIINMVMLLLGLPLFASREPKSSPATFLLACLGAGGCFVATFACKLLIGQDLFSFIMPNSDLQYKIIAWLPIIIFTPLSILALDSIKT